MKFEHFAINVPDARATARWQVDHLGFTLLRQQAEAPYTTFLADDTGRVTIELYSNPAAPYPDYPNQSPLVFHLALAVTNARAEQARLEKAGATWFADVTPPDGSLLVMMRDPWGVPVQLCQRAKPF